MSPLTSLHNRRFMSQARKTRNFARIFLLPSPRDSRSSCAKCRVRLAWLIRNSYAGYLLHTKRVFPFSLALRIRRTCSSNETYKLRCNELAQYLNGHCFLNQKIQRVHTITRTDALKPSDAITDLPTTRGPLVAGYSENSLYSLNIIYFSRTHSHSIFLPTLCYCV